MTISASRPMLISSVAADIEDFAPSGGTVLQPHQRLDGVLDGAEAAGLAAVAIDPQRLAAPGRLDKAWQDHAVLAGLPGADGVEKPRDDHRGPLFPGMRQGQEFIHQFGAGITPPAQVRRADEQVILLRERLLLALAINLGRRGQ